MISTKGGMRRLLQKKDRVDIYIKKAVESGVYRSTEELEKVRQDRKHHPDDLKTIMNRFRMDVVRGTHIHDYPAEYQILSQHPPIPDPPRIPLHVIRKEKKLENKLRTKNERQHKGAKNDAPLSLRDLIKKQLTREEAKLEPTSSGELTSTSDPNEVVMTSDEYYRRLLGVQAAKNRQITMGSSKNASSFFQRKSATVQKAYETAIHQYQLLRTNEKEGGMTEEEALRQVDEIMKEAAIEEQRLASHRVVQAEEFKSQQATQSLRKTEHDSPKATTETFSLQNETERKSRVEKVRRGTTTLLGDEKEAVSSSKNTDSSEKVSLNNIFKSDVRIIEGMMKWSERLAAVPYQQWTVGASTALDHWIACRVLGLHETTWLALLEGSDPALIQQGEQIVQVRHALFPETLPKPLNRADGQDIHDDAKEDAFLNDGTGASVGDQGLDATTDFMREKSSKPQTKNKEERTIEELLAALSTYDTKQDRKVLDENSESSFNDEPDRSSRLWSEEIVTAKSPGPSSTVVERLTAELQDWRQKHVSTPFDQWPISEREDMDRWVRLYVSTLLPAVRTDELSSRDDHNPAYRMNDVDYHATRDALLAAPPVSPDESMAFWSQLRHESNAAALLDKMRRGGPPAGGHVLHQAFWDLPYQVQLQQLLNIGSLRPILDEYSSAVDRREFLYRYGDVLMMDVPLEHLVEDPNGPIGANDLDMATVEELRIDQSSRFRLVVHPFRAVMKSSASDRECVQETAAWVSKPEGGSGASSKARSDDGRKDGMGMSAIERTRLIYSAWNEHKANRAHYEEKLFITGRLGLRYSDHIPADGLDTKASPQRPK
jgi:alkylated DNA nucleotide flippase Atl1